LRPNRCLNVLRDSGRRPQQLRAPSVALLTDDAWLRMPPQPHQYQGHAAIAAFLRDRATMRGTPLRMVATRANTQPAFGCYLPLPHAAIARAYGLLVLTLDRDQIAAITWFSDTSVFPTSGYQEPCTHR
jgi:hypothetical protein